MTTRSQPQAYTAKLEDKLVFNQRFFQASFELVSPPRLEFKAGQYVSVQVSDQGHRRPYSICSSPDITHGFEILVDTGPGGVGSRFLQNLEFGQQVSLLAPLGDFVINASSAEAVVLVGNGSGISPLRGMVLDLLQVRHDQRPITLHWGMRRVDELFWENEFQQLSQDFENFYFHPVISQAAPDWTLCRGRVTDCLAVHGFPQQAEYYLCGSTDMIDQSKQVLAQGGVAAAQIHHEKFY
ncbi:MAG: hypothetical protein COU69_03865 [Candidatus Pacebacteria bacterium CG10_big_fil_rev_8_21_14_0_10_56_10]|nr:MAG: hypothetical protein COU69_03865 [Candidatus Pacebacteria bacterium CG10_big_fil_rev_8_21_14_0_10_56_10]